MRRFQHGRANGGLHHQLAAGQAAAQAAHAVRGQVEGHHHARQQHQRRGRHPPAIFARQARHHHLAQAGAVGHLAAELGVAKRPGRHRRLEADHRLGRHKVHIGHQHGQHVLRVPEPLGAVGGAPVGKEVKVISGHRPISLVRGLREWHGYSARSCKSHDMPTHSALLVRSNRMWATRQRSRSDGGCSTHAARGVNRLASVTGAGSEA